MSSVNVELRYPGSELTGTIKRVPTSSSVGRLKVLIARIRKLPSPEPIRIVHQGRILRDECVLETLFDETPESVTFWVTGVPGLAVSAQNPIAQPKPPEQVVEEGSKSGKGLMHLAYLVWVGTFLCFFSIGVPLLLGRDKLELARDTKLKVSVKAVITGTFAFVMSAYLIWKGARAFFESQMGGIVWVSVVEFLRLASPFWDERDFKRRYEDVRT
jgi:hypothetical protein